MVVVNRCPVDVWVRPAARPQPPPGWFDEDEPHRVPAGRTVRLKDAALDPPSGGAGSMAVSGDRNVVGAVVPLPYRDDHFEVVLEGPQCPQ